MILHGKFSRLVVVGGGYAGLRAAFRLSSYLRPPAEGSVTLINRDDGHLLTTELPELVSARVACLSCRIPLGPLLERRGIEFRQGEVESFDSEEKVVHVGGEEIPFDKLVLAPGSVLNVRSDDGQEIPGARGAYTVCSFEDACRLRRRVQKCFSDALEERDASARRNLLTFVVVGGGSTGVEVAGELSHRLRWLSEEARLDHDEPKLTLLEATSRLVPGFGPGNSRQVEEALERTGVRVRLKSKVVAYDGRLALLESGEEIPAPTLVWAAGVRAAPLIENSGLKVDLLGRAHVTPLMQAEGFPDIYVIGDSANAKDSRGRTIRPNVQVALQEADAVAWNIAAELGAQEKTESHPRQGAMLVCCGGSKAIGRVGPFSISGSSAWLLKELASARYLRSLGHFGLFRKIFKQKLEGYGHKHE